ncbi:hypothetical protein BJ166DRAFT_194811 [Pestalotiopsis sp. NC0098]|nr:hypothetical protein BJ166DRAFT_194811 [Pestalotiopsis sp. NC0098]
MNLFQAFESFGALRRAPKRLSMTSVADRPRVQGPGFGSLEDIHNIIPGLVGGSGDHKGHMKMIAKSAFDPIFWLHHTNNDRLLAIWQSLHDDPTRRSGHVAGTFLQDGWQILDVS